MQMARSKKKAKMVSNTQTLTKAARVKLEKQLEKIAGDVAAHAKLTKKPDFVPTLLRAFNTFDPESKPFEDAITILVDILNEENECDFRGVLAKLCEMPRYKFLAEELMKVRRAVVLPKQIGRVSFNEDLNITFEIPKRVKLSDDAAVSVSGYGGQLRQLACNRFVKETVESRRQVEREDVEIVFTKNNPKVEITPIEIRDVECAQETIRCPVFKISSSNVWGKVNFMKLIETRNDPDYKELLDNMELFKFIKEGI